MLKNIKENLKNVVSNINYLNLLKFTDIEDIFERYVFLFLYDEKIFKNKISNLINKIGPNYVVEIESNLELLEELI